jgi:hypothetical protein
VAVTPAENKPAVTPAAKKGALAKEPSKRPGNLVRTSPGVYKDPKTGALFNSAGRMTRPGKGGAMKAEPKPKPKPAPVAPAPVQTAPTEQQPPQDQGPAPIKPEELYGNMANYYRNFDPNQIMTGMQPQFTESMQQAGDAQYNEFMRRAEPEFGRQRQQLEQQLIERGLDPQGEAFKYNIDQLSQQQNDARQSARAQATQAGIDYQQQMFNQGTKLAGMPAEIAGQFAQPYNIGLQGQVQQGLNQQNFGFESQLSKQGYQQNRGLQGLQNRGAAQVARINARNRGGGGGGYEQMTPDIQYALNQFGLQDQSADPNYLSQGLSAGMQAFGNVMGQRLAGKA